VRSVGQEIEPHRSSVTPMCRVIRDRGRECRIRLEKGISVA
jgi:hypothetical protein